MMFRFDEVGHRYLEDGIERPHITGMLLRCGLVDDRWYTDESSERGRAIHKLTADYDLGAIPVLGAVTSKYKPYLLAHAAAMAILRPTFYAIEEASVHPTFRFGGRPDREGLIYGFAAVLEGKSGGPEKSHQVQTALQAILVAPKFSLPPEVIKRYVLYWNRLGRFRLEEHTSRDDFRKARAVIAECCR